MGSAASGGLSVHDVGVVAFGDVVSDHADTPVRQTGHVAVPLAVQLPRGELLVGVDVDAVTTGEAQVQPPSSPDQAWVHTAPARFSSGRS